MVFAKSHGQSPVGASFQGVDALTWRDSFRQKNVYPDKFEALRKDMTLLQAQ
jgi:hypothetical protein